MDPVAGASLAWTVSQHPRRKEDERVDKGERSMNGDGDEAQGKAGEPDEGRED